MARADLAQIHNEFSPKTYQLATGVGPGALGRLLRGFHPARFFDSSLVASERIRVTGEIETFRALIQRGTIILAPTHLSNLDAPVIGFGLYHCGLPPFVYGAGLNLFTQPVMAYFMSRLGAYTVDRTRRSNLYKAALKAYSTEALASGHHSLFFPGGTRSRSGTIEARVKKGLLGTGLAAWQAKLARGEPQSDVFVVPCSLSMSLVLEAETLISDSLLREGRGRYIIVDDEFSETRTILGFLKRMMAFDDPVQIVFGQPMDLMGNPVDAEGISHDPQGRAIDRLSYVTNRAGEVVKDTQRDRIYTDRLGQKLIDAWHRDTTALPTHIAAFAAWAILSSRHPQLDAYRLVRLDASNRAVPFPHFLTAIARTVRALQDLRTSGSVRLGAPTDPETIAAQALKQFASFHTLPALHRLNEEVHISMELTLYYRNRLIGFGLDEQAIGALP
jgi:glycerol-3-phosphate O-acyltransferase